jgi:hypothetical protein
MLRRLLVALSLAALLVGVMAIGASAATGSSRQPLPPPPSPATHPCPGGAEVVVTINKFNEYAITTPIPNGTPSFISGVVLATFTNPANGRSMLVNDSGSGTLTIYSDGSGSFIGHGPSGAPFAPEFGLFPWDNVYGTLQYTFDSFGNTTSVSSTGHVIDICAALT